MSYLVLARKWRPKQFDDVVGQKPITQTLKNAIISGRTAHAYLFSGPRGVGKTTTARILAKALNCKEGPTPQPCDACEQCNEINKGTSLDVIEIDGASNNSVDDIRTLREKVHYIPSKGRYKVYIIDEVHMLSNQAFNALLKTLEEPPPHIIFILATTEAHKIPITIISRCQRYDFRKISNSDIRAYLDALLKEEGDLTGERDEAIRLIAQAADGSLRDALSLMDQVISLSEGKVSVQEIQDLVSIVDRHTIGSLLNAIIGGDAREVLMHVERVIDRGHDLKHFVEQILQYIHDVITLKLYEENPEGGLDLSPDEKEELQEISQAASREDLLRYFDILVRSLERMKLSSQPRIVLEMSLIRLSELPRLESINDLISRLELLEQTSPAVHGPAIERPSKTASPSPQPLNREDLPQVTHESIPQNTGQGDLSFIEDHDFGAEDVEKDIQQAEEVLHDMHKPGDEKDPDWPKIVEHVKGESMTFGSVLEHIKVKHDEGTAVLELAIQKDTPFFMRLIEDKKNQALLQAALSKVKGKDIEIRWTFPDKKGKTVQRSSVDKKAPAARISMDSSLDLVNKNPIIQKAMDIFSAEIVKTHIAEDEAINTPSDYSKNNK